jgi:hypothetical protein
MSPATLVGQSSLGFDSLLEDIRVTEQENGFRHYLSNARVTLVNDFVRTHANRAASAPPTWTSTYNVHESDSPAGPPDPRVGIQQVVPGRGSLTVRWDVALNLNRVQYALYLQTTPFNFGADPSLSGARRIVLTPSVGAGYADGPGPSTYPNEATVTGLSSGQTYYLVIRAFDATSAGNEEQNQTVLTGTPN